MRHSNEPLLWALFSAGGVLTALLAPVLIVMTGFVLPADEVAFTRVEDIFTNVLVRFLILALTSLAFMHFANRFRHTLNDMGLAKSLFKPASLLSYALALAGTVWAATIVFG
jgi:fumarate reductase subunit D